jgi:hypothetical protein
MSIKPIDFQVMLPKTSEVSKIHNDEQHRNLSLQQQQAATVQNKAETNIRQVHTQEKTQEARIREKQEKDKGGKKEEKKKNKGNYGIKKELNDENKTSFIDIRL